MVTVTDAAKAVLGAMLSKSQASESSVESPDQRCLRMIYRGKVLGVGLDAPRDGDEVVSHEGKALLVISHEVDAKLNGATIGARRTPAGDKLVLSRPKAN